MSVEELLDRSIWHLMTRWFERAYQGFVEKMTKKTARSSVRDATIEWTRQQRLPEILPKSDGRESGASNRIDSGDYSALLEGAIGVMSGKSFARDYVHYLGVQLIVLDSKVPDFWKAFKACGQAPVDLIVFRIRELEAHPEANISHCDTLVPFLRYQSSEIATAARCAIDTLSTKVPRMATWDPPIVQTHEVREIEAEVQWLEANSATVRFKHPFLGIVEREFERGALPPGAECGDTFSLRVEVNTAGRVVGYQAIRNAGLKKRLPAEWEKIPIPPTPEDTDDPEEMDRYDAEMDQYMIQTTALRARDAAHWKATGKP